jgi:hypothetical protein
VLRVADLETDSLQQPPEHCIEVSSLDGYDAESAQAFNGDYQGDSGDEDGSEPPEDPNLVSERHRHAVFSEAPVYRETTTSSLSYSHLPF